MSLVAAGWLARAKGRPRRPRRNSARPLQAPLASLAPPPCLSLCLCLCLAPLRTAPFTPHKAGPLGRSSSGPCSPPLLLLIGGRKSVLRRRIYGPILARCSLLLIFALIFSPSASLKICSFKLRISINSGPLLCGRPLAQALSFLRSS